MEWRKSYATAMSQIPRTRTPLQKRKNLWYAYEAPELLSKAVSDSVSAASAMVKTLSFEELTEHKKLLQRQKTIHTVHVSILVYTWKTAWIHNQLLKHPHPRNYIYFLPHKARKKKENVWRVQTKWRRWRFFQIIEEWSSQRKNWEKQRKRNCEKRMTNCGIIIVADLDELS